MNIDIITGILDKLQRIKTSVFIQTLELQNKKDLLNVLQQADIDCKDEKAASAEEQRDLMKLLGEKAKELNDERIKAEYITIVSRHLSEDEIEQKALDLLQNKPMKEFLEIISEYKREFKDLFDKKKKLKVYIYDINSTIDIIIDDDTCEYKNSVKYNNLKLEIYQKLIDRYTKVIDWSIKKNDI